MYRYDMPPLQDLHRPSVCLFYPTVCPIRPPVRLSVPSVRPTVLSNRLTVPSIRPSVRPIHPSDQNVMMPPPPSAGQWKALCSSKKVQVHV